MMKQKSDQELTEKLAAPRELAQSERQQAMAVPALRENLLRNEAQDGLLSRLPEPRLSSAVIGRVLSRTTLAQKPTRQSFWRRRWVWSALAVGAALAISLSGTGYAAAQSLPGDTLYDLKRGYEQVRMSLMANPQRREVYAEQLSLVRQAEARRMLELGRQGVELELTGILQREADGRWSVSGVPVELENNGWEPGMQVQMRGAVVGGRIKGRAVHTGELGGEGMTQPANPGRYGQTAAAETAEPEATPDTADMPGQGSPRKGAAH